MIDKKAKIAVQANEESAKIVKTLSEVHSVPCVGPNFMKNTVSVYGKELEFASGKEMNTFLKGMIFGLNKGKF